MPLISAIIKQSFGIGSSGKNGCGRVVRGGSWNNNTENCRASYRNNRHPQNRNNKHFPSLDHEILHAFLCKYIEDDQLRQLIKTMFVNKELSCPAYLRYVDDFALFSNSKAQLWQWKKEIIERLASLRLRVHEHSAQVVPCATGIPWLGFVIYPSHKRIKARKVVHASRRISERYDAWQQGKISFGEFDASVQGWINHVRYADT